MKKIIINSLISASLIVSFNAMAYSVVIKNNTETHIMPFIESLHELSPDSVNSWINPNSERIYDLRSSWLNSGSMDVKVGDTREIKFGNISCGKVKFKNIQSIEIFEIDGLVKCSVSIVPRVTESVVYKMPVNEYKMAYVFTDFNNKNDIEIPESYVDGPRKIYNTPYENILTTKVRVNAVNDQTRKEHPIFIEIWRNIGSRDTRQMNNRVGMYDYAISHFTARFVPEWNENLPEGNYTGITKISAVQNNIRNDFNFGVTVSKK